MFETLIEMLDFNSLPAVLFPIPWQVMVTMGIITVIVYAIGVVWYGFIFRNRWMKLAGKPVNEKTNVPAMVVQLLSAVALVFFVLCLILLSAGRHSFVFIIIVLFVSQAVGMLAHHMFHGGSNRQSLKLWMIHTGHYLITLAVTSAALFIYFDA